MTRKKRLAWTRYVVGLSTFAVSLYLMLQEHPIDRWHVTLHSILLGVSILVLPGVFEPMYAHGKKLVALYREWKAPPA